MHMRTANTVMAVAFWVGGSSAETKPVAPNAWDPGLSGMVEWTISVFEDNIALPSVSISKNEGDRPRHLLSCVRGELNAWLLDRTIAFAKAHRHLMWPAPQGVRSEKSRKAFRQKKACLNGKARRWYTNAN
jgi:hypothetical protein